MIPALVLLSLMFLAAVIDRDGLGRVVHRVLIVTPARMLNAMTRGRWIALVLFVGLAAMLTLQFEVDGFRLFSLAAPELLVWAALFDIGVVVEITLLAMMLAGRQGVAAARSIGKTLLKGPRRALTFVRTLGRIRAPRRRPTRKLGSSSDDDLAGFVVA